MAYRDVILSDSPSYYLRFDETSGTVATAEVGPVNGTYLNTPTLGVAGALVGDPNKAVLLTRSQAEAISIADNAALDFGDVFTIEMWIKRSALAGTQQGLYDKNDVRINVETNNVIEFTKPGTGVALTSSVGVADTNWHHIVVQKNGATAHAIYIDAVQRNSGSGTLRGVANGNATAYVGANGAPTTSNAFDGSIDEFAVYPSYLSAARIQAHYNAAMTPPYEEALGMVGA